MDCMPVVQDHFPPDHRGVEEMLRTKIGECQALIHIAGMRYGAEPEPDTLPEGAGRRSYTQMELDMARELGLERVFTFVCGRIFPTPPRTQRGGRSNPSPRNSRPYNATTANASSGRRNSTAKSGTRRKSGRG